MRDDQWPGLERLYLGRDGFLTNRSALPLMAVGLQPLTEPVTQDLASGSVSRVEFSSPETNRAGGSFEGYMYLASNISTTS